MSYININILKRDIITELNYVRDFDIRKFKHPIELFEYLNGKLLMNHVYAEYAEDAVREVFHGMHHLTSCYDNDQRK